MRTIPPAHSSEDIFFKNRTLEFGNLEPSFNQVGVFQSRYNTRLSNDGAPS